MSINLFRFIPIGAALILSSTMLTGCLDDNDVDYNEWEAKNTAYVADMEALSENGKSVYTRLTPPWAPAAFTLVKWENDRSLTAHNLQPLDNSLVRVQYALDNIEGKRIADSYSATASYGDSIYQTRPNQNIVGFHYALTQMRVGDVVKCIIPYAAGYGNVQSGQIPPYSTLVYTIKLVSIPKYELPSE